MALKYRKIWRDNYASISSNEFYNNLGINDIQIRKFIKDSCSWGTIDRKMVYHYVTKKVIDDIGKLFADAYNSKNYDEIDKYINDNNINPEENYDLKVINKKAVIRRIMIETLQDHLLLNKYIIHGELIEYFKKVLPYCIKKYTLQYIQDYFIPNK